MECRHVTKCPCGLVKARCSACMAKSNCVHGVRKWLCKGCSPHLVCAHGGFHRECMFCRGKPRRPREAAPEPREAAPEPRAASPVAEPACVGMEELSGDAGWLCGDGDEDPFAGLLDCACL
jgi:hypothetical protein